MNMSVDIEPATQNRDVADELQSLALVLSDAAASIREGSLDLESNTPRRLRVISAARDAVDLIKADSDDVLDWISLLAQFSAIRLFVKWKVFEKIPIGKDARISYQVLAGQVGADVALIGIHSFYSPSPSHRGY